MNQAPDYDANGVDRLLLNTKTGVVHPAWTSLSMAGLIPTFLDIDDDASAVEQLNAGYGMGFYSAMHMEPVISHHETVGGATLLFTNVPRDEDEPLDPPLAETSRCKLRDETIILFEYAWTTVLDAEGQLVECVRLD